MFEDTSGQLASAVAAPIPRVLLIKQVEQERDLRLGQGEARWTGDVKPDRAGPVKLQAGDLDAMLLNLAIVRDVAAGKPLNYRMVDDGRAKQ